MAENIWVGTSCVHCIYIKYGYIYRYRGVYNNITAQSKDLWNSNNLKPLYGPESLVQNSVSTESERVRGRNTQSTDARGRIPKFKRLEQGEESDKMGCSKNTSTVLTLHPKSTATPTEDTGDQAQQCHVWRLSVELSWASSSTEAHLSMTQHVSSNFKMTAEEGRVWNQKGKSPHCAVLDHAWEVAFSPGATVQRNKDHPDDFRRTRHRWYKNLTLNNEIQVAELGILSLEKKRLGLGLGGEGCLVTSILERLALWQSG